MDLLLIQKGRKSRCEKNAEKEKCRELGIAMVDASAGQERSRNDYSYGKSQMQKYASVC
jgi:hypothetical protein